MAENVEGKKWWTSNTLQVAAAQFLTALVVVLQTQYPEAGYLLMAKSLLDMWLRAKTDKPINS